MPVLVKIMFSGRVVCVYSYDSMKTAVKHSKKMISYYDIGKKPGKYNTYKTFIDVRHISEGEFRLVKAIYNICV